MNHGEEKKMKLLKIGFLFVLAGMLMGNKGCKEEPITEKRELRRRVQMGSIQAPQMVLPPQAGGGTFDFSLALNGQLQKVLRESKTFSTSGVFYDPSSIGENDKKEFYQCTASAPTKAFEISEDTACMINMPLGYVSAQMIDFRFQRGIDVDVGITGLDILEGVSFNFDKAKFTMSMQAQNPILTMQPQGHTLAAKNGHSYMGSVGGKVSLNFGFVKLGLGGWMQTDMAKVVEDGLSDGLKKLKTDWDQNDAQSGYENVADGWYAHVIKDCDVGIMIAAGNKSDAGLQVGDILSVYNMRYNWYGKACNSRLNYMEPTTEQPIAYVKIVRVSDTVSKAVIIDNDPNYPYQEINIKPGARVYMKKWAEVTPQQQAKK
jgi:hypothetical protein